MNERGNKRLEEVERKWKTRIRRQKRTDTMCR